MSDKGWTSQYHFTEYMLAFAEATENMKKPIVLFVDGHISHQSIEVSKLCEDNEIILYSLPPHASHIVQPLDVGIFKTMKAE